MPTRKHVVYSATRQWNPGDEFILRGARRVVETKIGSSNAILYNRNPDVRPDSFELALRADKNVMRGLYGDTEAYLRYGFHDNSVKSDGDFSFVDLAVVAGSPEWTTPRCYNFFEHVVKNATPVVILGVGSLEPSPPSFVVEVAKKARFFSVRSEDLLADRPWARDAGAVYLPCPALLAADEKNERKIDAVRRIALVYSAPERDSIRANSVANEVADAILALYRRLLETRSERVEFFGVCHYIDELPGATRFFGAFGVPVFYAYDSADYEEIYGRADLTVSARVHACGLSASLGVPGVFFGTDARAGT
ncbi:MAG: polysaccharide pyruvyl transferase family protein [Thermoguttaceae bacterium]|nr:polysaccharide pyruvyl transferase family protein [Thermoguttaceae bacterium]